MKYTDKSFTVPVGGDAYRENFDRIFRKKEIEPGDRTRAASLGLDVPMPIEVERVDALELGQCVGCKEPLWYHPDAGAPDFCHPCRIEMAVPYLEGGAK